MSYTPSSFSSASPPYPENEPVKDYLPNSEERISLEKALSDLRAKVIDIPMYINGQEVRTKKSVPVYAPHDHQHQLGTYYEGEKKHAQAAIEAALAARSHWASLDWTERSSIFLRAAELLAGPYRMAINARTMLGQSKNVFQAEVDAACELIDFLRYNVAFMADIYAEQPVSDSSIWNRVEYRPLEGFILAITPFNFTSIAANLACAPALMGNVVVWKPSPAQIYSAQVIMEVLQAAGLPDGVINLVYTEASMTAEVALSHRAFAGLHFTGSTTVFKQLWKTSAQNVDIYCDYPRIVGETGGKDFIMAHPSADVDSLRTAIVRGAFEYQGQKCSAASRCYVPKSIWNQGGLRDSLIETMHQLKMGGVEDFSNFINAVITKQSYDRLKAYIEKTKQDASASLLAGGRCDDSQGYFVQPTLFELEKGDNPLLCEELFGPVLGIYVYADKRYEETLDLINNTSPYGLTGAIFSTQRAPIQQALARLRYAAGNVYINDKPTGAVVGRQPFGGGRASGTNDKAGAPLNLLRWTSLRTIKETFVPAVHYPYPFMSK